MRGRVTDVSPLMSEPRMQVNGPVSNGLPERGTGDGGGDHRQSGTDAQYSR